MDEIETVVIRAIYDSPFLLANLDEDEIDELIYLYKEKYYEKREY